MKKLINLCLTVITFSLLSSSSVLAHVTVSPSEVGIGKFQTFTVNVPNEKDIATTQVRLILPDGLNHVSPTVKNGWSIQTVKSEGEDQHISEIIWSDGTIPPEQRDEFSFSVQVPTNETELSWKAYQTYEDGGIVSWDQTSQEETNHAENTDKEHGPASVTHVINDLTPSLSEDRTSQPQSNTAIILSGIALGLSVITFVRQMRQK